MRDCRAPPPVRRRPGLEDEVDLRLGGAGVRAGGQEWRQPPCEAEEELCGPPCTPVSFWRAENSRTRASSHKNARPTPLFSPRPRPSHRCAGAWGPASPPGGCDARGLGKEKWGAVAALFPSSAAARVFFFFTRRHRISLTSCKPLAHSQMVEVPAFASVQDMIQAAVDGHGGQATLRQVSFVSAARVFRAVAAAPRAQRARAGGRVRTAHAAAT